VAKKFTHIYKFYEVAVPMFNLTMSFGDQMILT